MRVLFFSAVCKSLEIFRLASESYFKLNQQNFDLDFLFLDDNTDARTSAFLNQIKQERPDVKFLDYKSNSKTTYTNHDWDSKKIDRIIAIKNAALAYAATWGYDYIFLVDADLVLHPDSLQCLISREKDFVFTIFWTKFREDSPYTPNAWDYHSWDYRGPDSYFRLKVPGLHEVGGGGACTLLSRESITRGLTFDRLSSMNFPGEDRHFCTRAQALGYPVYVDSTFPAYHLFNDEMVPEAFEWYVKGADPQFFDKWLDQKWVEEVNRRFDFNDDFPKRFKKFLLEVVKSFKTNFLTSKVEKKQIK